MTDDRIRMQPDLKKKTGGESQGGAYPNPHSGKKSKPGEAPSDFTGHGGQSGMAYHGTGQLGAEEVEGEENPNAPAKEE
ncbi:MAG TPA: hypothetical protein VI381_07625 [Allosphingosinicella sp.]